MRSALSHWPAWLVGAALLAAGYGLGLQARPGMSPRERCESTRREFLARELGSAEALAVTARAEMVPFYEGQIELLKAAILTPGCDFGKGGQR